MFVRGAGPKHISICIRKSILIERYKSFTMKPGLLRKVLYTSRDWNGWFVAVEDEKVVGAIGGGMMTEDKGEIFVFYMDLNRRGEGIGRSIDCRTKSIWRVRTMGISRKRE